MLFRWIGEQDIAKALGSDLITKTLTASKPAQHAKAVTRQKHSDDRLEPEAAGLKPRSQSCSNHAALNDPQLLPSRPALKTSPTHLEALFVDRL